MKALLVALAFVLVFGSIWATMHEPSYSGGGVLEANIPSGVIGDDSSSVNEGSELLPEAPELPYAFSVESIDIEKEMYHSNDLMHFTVLIYSDAVIEDVSVQATGISERLNIAKTVTLLEGENIVDFEYNLPSCNRCGGIGAGTHEITVSVHKGDISAEACTSVEIQQ
jgi:hypothetical protein